MAGTKKGPKEAGSIAKQSKSFSNKPESKAKQIRFYGYENQILWMAKDWLGLQCRHVCKASFQSYQNC